MLMPPTISMWGLIHIHFLLNSFKNELFPHVAFQSSAKDLLTLSLNCSDLGQIICRCESLKASPATQGVFKSSTLETGRGS